jgi:hypothetical protein
MDSLISTDPEGESIMNARMKRAMGMGLSALALVAVAFATACSSSSSPPPPCNQNPFECAAGQTCWVTDTAGTFACLNSGAGQVGGSCAATVDVPTCGDGLACLQMDLSVPGTCLQFCDPTNPSHGCPGGGACEPAGFSTTAMFHVCSGVSTGPADSGAPADTGAGKG